MHKTDLPIKSFTSKKGRLVVFRFPTHGDLPAMHRFANKLVAEDTFVELFGKPVSLTQEAKVLRDILSDMKKGKRVHIVAEVDGAYAGNGEVRRLTRRKHHVAELGISLAVEFREEGIGMNLMKTLIDEAKTIGVRLLVLHCFENNPRALHVYEKLGFIQSGVVPGAIAFRGQFVGEVTLHLPLVQGRFHGKKKTA